MAESDTSDGGDARVDACDDALDLDICVVQAYRRTSTSTSTARNAGASRSVGHGGGGGGGGGGGCVDATLGAYVAAVLLALGPATGAAVSTKATPAAETDPNDRSRVSPEAEAAAAAEAGCGPTAFADSFADDGAEDERAAAAAVALLLPDGNPPEAVRVWLEGRHNGVDDQIMERQIEDAVRAHIQHPRQRVHARAHDTHAPVCTGLQITICARAHTHCLLPPTLTPVCSASTSAAPCPWRPGHLVHRGFNCTDARQVPWAIEAVTLCYADIRIKATLRALYANEHFASNLEMGYVRSATSVQQRATATHDSACLAAPFPPHPAWALPPRESTWSGSHKQRSTVRSRAHACPPARAPLTPNHHDVHERCTEPEVAARLGSTSKSNTPTAIRQRSPFSDFSPVLPCRSCLAVLALPSLPSLPSSYLTCWDDITDDALDHLDALGRTLLDVYRKRNYGAIFATGRGLERVQVHRWGSQTAACPVQQWPVPPCYP